MKKKEIYSFDIFEEKEVEESEVKKLENGEEVTVTKKVIKKVPTHIVIKHPSRKEIEEADLVMAIKQSELIKRGILTRAMIAKKYSDTGGVLTEDQSKEIARKYKKMSDLQYRFMQLTVNVKKKTKAQEEEVKEVIEELNSIRREIADTESSYSTLFQHSADVKAQNHVILWYSLMLTFIEDVEKDEWIPYFEGETFEEKLESFYQKEEEPTDFYNDLRQKLSYIISFWYHGAAQNKKEFDKLVKDIDEGNV